MKKKYNKFGYNINIKDMDLNYKTNDDEYTLDNQGFNELIGWVMNAPECTLAHQVRNDWAELAVTINVDKLYESVE